MTGRWRKMIPGLLLLAAAMVVLPTSLEARRGFRIPIIVPGGGGGVEGIEKVLELPDIPELRRLDGTYIDLGYLHQRDGGAWIGYIGSSTTYLTLSDQQLRRLMQVAGVRELPPVPVRAKPAGVPGLYWMIGLAAVVAIIGIPIARRFAGALGGFSRMGGRIAMATGAPASSGSAASSRAMARVTEAVERRNALSGAGAGAASETSQPAAVAKRPAKRDFRPSNQISAAAASTFGVRGERMAMAGDGFGRRNR